MTSLNSTRVSVRTHCKNNNESTKGRVVELDDGGCLAHVHAMRLNVVVT